MYENYFGFTEKPFNLTPDPKFYFPSRKHREAMDSLIYAVMERKGFGVVTGEVGSGKTTVCRTLLEELHEKVTLAIITNTFVTPKQLLAMILEEFEIYHQEEPKHKILFRLNHFLIEKLAESKNVVLIIDEAQNLTAKCLEEVRMLSNLETDKDKLIQIILMGQPELRQKLADPSMLQLRQRIAVHYHLTPLSKEETHLYIAHRVHIASEDPSPDKKYFTDEAVELIYEMSQGIPRIINNICDNAFLSAYAQGLKVVNESIVCEVSRDIINVKRIEKEDHPFDANIEVIKVQTKDKTKGKIKVKTIKKKPSQVMKEEEFLL